MSEAKTKKQYRIEGRPRTIFRVVKSAKNPYVMIDRRPIDNSGLSFKAKGILTYLMSRPDGWEVSIADLINHATDGEDSVRSGAKELRNAGHMKYRKMREKGRITGWLIEVYEVPLPVFPDVVSPDLEKPTQVISTLISIDREIGISDFPFFEVETVSKHWHEISEQKPSRTLRAAFKRLFVFGDKCQMKRGTMLSDMISLVEKTFLNGPEFPEKYMIACVDTLQDTYRLWCARSQIKAR